MAPRKLTHEEARAIDDSTRALLYEYGVQVDELRIDSKTGRILLPTNIENHLNLSRSPNRKCGLQVMMAGLKDEALNGRWFHIVKTLDPDQETADENPKMIIDVTPEDAAPMDVRYVIVPQRKAALERLQPTHTGYSNRAFTGALNLTQAFAQSGLDLRMVESLAVRPHPDIGFAKLWRDLPALCKKLNRTNAPGAPFHIEFGYQVFGDPCLDDPAKVFYHSILFYALYTVEPYAILRNCKGCAIDCAQDITPGSFEGEVLHTHKFYVKDTDMSYETWSLAREAIVECVEAGWMPTDPFMEWHGTRMHGFGDSSEQLGMIKQGLNSCWPDQNSKVIMIEPFHDSGLDVKLDKCTKARYKELIEQRKRQVEAGVCRISRNMAVKLARSHAGETDHQFLRRDELGTICFSCYTRITVEEQKLCGGCGKARYCSPACQAIHWSQHKHCCASKEERERRQKAREAAAAERAAQLRVHDEREALQRAEEAAREATRRAGVAAQRAQRAEKRVQEVLALAAAGDNNANGNANNNANNNANRKKNKGLKSGNDSGRRGMEAQLTHEAWVSTAERTARIEAFAAKQDAEHAAAEARKAQDKVDAIKKLEADISKELEARAHVVPPAPTMAAFF